MKMPMLPDDWHNHIWYARARCAVDAVVSCGAALEALRGGDVQARETESQLKTCVDRAAEGWVLGLLEDRFPEEPFLSEERYDNDPASFESSANGFWTVDALDGTRSYVEGFPGYCVQVAWVEHGHARVSAICEPRAERCYVAMQGAGAYLLEGSQAPKRLAQREGWSKPVRFVDSTRPTGKLGALFTELHAEFVECGSVGLKICRVADGSADIYAKRFRLKLWDIAPGAVLCGELGLSMTNFAGDDFPFTGSTIRFEDVLVVPASERKALVGRLKHH